MDYDKEPQKELYKYYFMRPKYLYAVLMLMICLSIFGQQAKIASIQEQPQITSTKVNINQQETILQLQKESERVKEDLGKLETYIDRFREDIRENVADIRNDLSQWLTVMALMITVVGIVIPLILNYRNESRLKKMLENAQTQANQAINEIHSLRQQVSDLQQKTNKDTLAAEEAAKEAKASQWFAQAISEKDPSKSIELYTQAIELKPDFSEAYNNRGIQKFYMKNWNDALSDYNEAIKLNSKNFEAYSNRGVLKVDMGDQDGALADYNKAIELKPDYADAYNNRADILLKEFGKPHDALNDVNIAIKIRGNEADYYVTRGEIYLALMQFKAAIKDFTQALEINNKDNDSYNNRAKCYRALADKERDKQKKAELIAKAEADKKKAHELRKQGK